MPKPSFRPPKSAADTFRCRNPSDRISTPAQPTRSTQQEQIIKTFARSSIVNLIATALNRRAQTGLPATTAPAPLQVKAHSPLADKADLLTRLWQSADPLTLLTIGRAVPEVRYDPIWKLALEAQSPDRLLDGWQRFEKYAHSTNRVQIERPSTTEVICTRYAMQGPAPTRAENHLICGILTALLDHIGCEGLHCSAPDPEGKETLLFAEGRFLETVNEIPFSLTTWSFTWRRHQRPDKEPSSDQNVLADLLSRPMPGAAQQIVTRAGHLIRRDITYPWKLEELAADLGLSTRSLQRRLGEAGLSFSALIRLSRISEASNLLKNGSIPIAAIGFCTGFSDSAHFARDFRTSMGMTPTDYRNGAQPSPAPTPESE